MKADTSKMPRIRDLKLSPEVNPLLDPQSIEIKKRWVKSGKSEEVINTATGEISGVAAIHQIEDKDDEEFVKVFAAGVAASYALSRTGQRVFQSVLDEYQRTPMNRGFADAVEIYWFGEGIAGRNIGMSEPTFNRGMRELLGKGFIYPRSPTTYWVNPSLFFKGNRVLFIKEYRRKAKSGSETMHEELEAKGQQRLID